MTWLSTDIEIYLAVEWVVEIDVLSVWGIGIDLFLCGGRKWLGLQSGSKLTWCLCWGALVFRVIEIGLFLGWSKVTRFLCGGPNWLGFCVRTEKYLVLKYGSKLIWFLCAGRKWPVFCVGIDWLSFCVGGRNWLGFCMRTGNHLVLVWASKLTWFCVGIRIDLVFVWRSKLTCF